MTCIRCQKTFYPEYLAVRITRNIALQRGMSGMLQTHAFGTRVSLQLSQFSAVTQSCLTLRPHGPQRTRPPCPQQLPEVTQTHVHWVSNAIQPSHPPSSPFPPTFSLSQHQGLSQWVSSLHQVARVLESQLQHQSFPGIFRTDFL